MWPVDTHFQVADHCLRSRLMKKPRELDYLRVQRLKNHLCPSACSGVATVLDDFRVAIFVCTRKASTEMSIFYFAKTRHHVEAGMDL